MNAIGFLLRHESQVPSEDGWLTAAEQEWLHGRRSPKRVSDWRLGRWTAKEAIRAFLELQKHPLPSDIEILAADDGAPGAFSQGRPLPLSLSLSHVHSRALCVVGPAGTALGCDLEHIEPRSAAFVESYFTSAEAVALAAVDSPERDLLANLIWAAKESALKALRCGLRADTLSVEATISSQLSDSEWGRLDVTSERHRTTFAGRWRRMGDLVMTIVSLPTSEELIDLR